MNTANQLVDCLQKISRQLADQGETLKVIQTQAILIASYNQAEHCPHCKRPLQPYFPDTDDGSDQLYRRFEAAILLNKKEKEVYRLRKAGKLKFVPHEKTSKIRYRHADLKACYLELWGRPMPE
ncbi:hypothetical protein SAMN05216436_10186 [bacterium A37T11]|nr:hypothetical protein SAMN05216436_10186 [bacterium A37T11]